MESVAHTTGLHSMLTMTACPDIITASQRAQAGFLGGGEMISPRVFGAASRARVDGEPGYGDMDIYTCMDVRVGL